MKEIISNIKTRFRKYWLIFIAVPIITAAVSGLAKDLPQTKTDQYTSTSEIYLGNFNSDNFNTPEKAIELIKSTDFLNTVIEKSQNKPDLIFLQQNLMVSRASSTAIDLKITTESDKHSNQILTDISNEFMKQSNDMYKKSVATVQESLDNLNNISDDSPAAVEKQQFRYSLNNRLNHWTAPKIVTTPMVEVSTDTVQHISSTSRMIIGFLLGIIASLLFLLTPEILRQK